MHWKNLWGLVLAGGCAGIINGLFGAGGGMVLVPLLSKLTDFDESQIFPSSVATVAPMCVVSLWSSTLHTAFPWEQAYPYLVGGAIGGLLAGFFGRKIPVLWLHRLLGALILWGGIRNLC